MNLQRTFVLSQNQLDAITTVAWVVLAVGVGLVVHRVVYALFARWSERHGNAFASAVVRQTRRSSRYILPLLAVLLALPNLAVPPDWTKAIIHLTEIATIVAIAGAVIATMRLWGDVTAAHHRIDTDDNLLARQLGTRVAIFTRVGISIVALVALGSILMTFPSIRTLGTTLLASAGVAGIVIGIAARPLFENLVAGVQLALTQPIRIDDVVIVEKQFGRIEEIHSTYVVVRLWDLRRMVLPLTYFIDTPFENWTRRTANLVGEVYVFTDWSFDVEGLRAELPRILERSPLWDQQTQSVQVTDATERAMQVRCLVSARNSAELWDLRCYAREAIVAYVRDRQPDALPRVRVEAPDPANPDTNGNGVPRAAGDTAANGRAIQGAVADGHTGPPAQPQ